MRRVGPALFVMAASLAPYLLTGYFDKRYFALLLISSSLASAVLFTPSARPLMLTVALGSSLLTGGLYLAGASWYSYNKIQEGNSDQGAAFLRALHECHLKQPQHTMIFPMSSNFLSARYCGLRV